MTKTWHDRLAQALEARGKTQADLVRITKAKASSVSAWVSGDTKMLEGRHAAIVCEFLRINQVWLFFGRGPSGLEEDVHDDADAFEAVPVVGTAQLGDDGYWHELEYPVGHGEGFVKYPSKDPNAYCLRVKGDSMWPRIKHGEFVVIEPNSAVVLGEEVMVQTKDGRSMIKILVSQRNSTIELHSINGAHKPITFEANQVEKMHYVADILKPHRYYERNV